MRKIICACMLPGMIMAYTSVYAQQDEKLTISTYYPAPNAVYQTIRLKPSDTPPAEAKPGQMYYNNTTDKIMYYSKAGSWAEFMGGSSGGGVDPWFMNGTAPASPKTGQIYFNATSNLVQYYDNSTTPKPVNVTIAGYWKEKYNTDHYDVYLANSTGRRVAFGAKAQSETIFPTSTLEVHSNDTSTKDVEKVAVFSKYFTNNMATQKMYISLFPGGAGVPAYMANTSVIMVPDGNLKLAVANKTKSIYFSIDSGVDKSAEVMHISNPAGVTYPSNYSVVIGNTTSPFPFTVDTNRKVRNQDAVFAVRGVQNGNKTGTFTVSIWGYTADLSYGCTLQNNAWLMDNFTRTDGTKNRYYAKFLQDRWGGANWYCGDAVTTGGQSIPWSNVTGWNKAFNDKSGGENGATLWDAAGNWWGKSSRASKENFVPLDPDKILQKIDQLDVARWNYKAQGYVTHIGPVAEDFYRLFKTGDSGTELSVIDSIGVSLAGVKALIGEVNAQQKEIEGLQSRLAAIRSRLSGGK